MKTTLSRCITAGVLFTAIVGTLSHFLYGWAGNNPFIGMFTPVNESVWEHIKLLFFPMLLFTACAVRYFPADCPNAGFALCKGNLLGCLLIPMLYYTYTGAFGIQSMAADIAIFFAAVLAAFLHARRLIRTGTAGKRKCLTALLTGAAAFSFFLFTFFPPHIPLFISP